MQRTRTLQIHESHRHVPLRVFRIAGADAHHHNPFGIWVGLNWRRIFCPYLAGGWLVAGGEEGSTARITQLVDWCKECSTERVSRLASRIQ